MNMSTDAATIDERPLSEIDVSDAQLYREDNWEPLFRRLRAMLQCISMNRAPTVRIGRSVPTSTSKQLIHSMRFFLQLMVFPLPKRRLKTS